VKQLPKCVEGCVQCACDNFYSWTSLSKRASLINIAPFASDFNQIELYSDLHGSDIHAHICHIAGQAKLST